MTCSLLVLLVEAVGLIHTNEHMLSYPGDHLWQAQFQTSFSKFGTGEGPTEEPGAVELDPSGFGSPRDTQHISYLSHELCFVCL